MSPKRCAPGPGGFQCKSISCDDDTWRGVIGRHGPDENTRRTEKHEGSSTSYL